MNNLIEVGSIAGIALLALLTIGIVFSRLYKRSTKETAFVRTGLGGQKVIMDGGAILLPVFRWETRRRLAALREHLRAGG